MNRRQAIKCCATLSAVAATAPSLLAKRNHATFRIGATDWSIKKRLQPDAFTFGRELGLDGVQYSFGEADAGMDLRRRENRITMRQLVRETGVGIASLAIGALNKIPFATTDLGEQLVVDCIQTMATLKEEAKELADADLRRKIAPNIVLLAFFSKGDIKGQPDLIAKVIEKLKRIAPAAEKECITLGLETWLNEEEHRHILESVASPSVKIYYDVANANKMGYDIYREIASLGTENICQIHCKENGFLLGEGQIDFQRLKRVITQIGYRDWLVIESAHPKGMDVASAYKHNARYLRSVFA